MKLETLEDFYQLGQLLDDLLIVINTPPKKPRKGLRNGLTIPQLAKKLKRSSIEDVEQVLVLAIGAGFVERGPIIPNSDTVFYGKQMTASQPSTEVLAR